jgi:hypothetical protein
MYNEKVLNPVQIWLPDFSAMYHYTKFGMASPQVGQNLAKGQEAIILDLETQAVVLARNNGLCAPSEVPFTVSR